MPDAGLRATVVSARAEAADDLAHVSVALRAARDVTDGARLLHVRRGVRAIAFSRRDSRRPGFEDAAAIARELGFAPLERHVGGAFAPLSPGSLIVDHYGTDADAGTTSIARFRAHSATLRDALRELGLDARVGELAGEYCPGEFSVNVGGRVKVAGVAQRVSGRAWVVSTVLQVNGVAALREVTARCARAFGDDIDTATMGDLEVAGVSLADAAEQVVTSFVAASLVSRTATMAAVLD